MLPLPSAHYIIDELLLVGLLLGGLLLSELVLERTTLSEFNLVGLLLSELLPGRLFLCYSIIIRSYFASSSVCLVAISNTYLPRAMPSYHVTVGAMALEDGRTEMLMSIRPGRVARYVWARPIGSFDWPMDAMQRHPGHLDMDYDELLAYVQASGRYWWGGMVYKSCPDYLTRTFGSRAATA